MKEYERTLLSGLQAFLQTCAITGRHGGMLRSDEGNLAGNNRGSLAGVYDRRDGDLHLPELDGTAPEF